LGLILKELWLCVTKKLSEELIETPSLKQFTIKEKIRYYFLILLCYNY